MNRYARPPTAQFTDTSYNTCLPVQLQLQLHPVPHHSSTTSHPSDETRHGVRDSSSCCPSSATNRYRTQGTVSNGTGARSHSFNIPSGWPQPGSALAGIHAREKEGCGLPATPPVTICDPSSLTPAAASLRERTSFPPLVPEAVSESRSPAALATRRQPAAPHTKLARILGLGRFGVP
ncbi:hypothetical protein LX32DRAFT_126606 [Colletotrichum zoysiae]|uniref:Uncharacterized protein n=1 Tax=Colletotrichum zoysiae TaxID=1216348 RepID=A0AAD9H8L9_9PEZI|nr:hypothetical protein LX32DRAFT_126606 [Colletotrichum zoysiae]